ncbi:MAG: hypothetical protein ACQUHE_00145 [Bacteroidia bacterium]
MKSNFKIFALFIIVLLSSCKKEIEEKQNIILLLTKPSGWLTAKVEEKSATGTWTDITSKIGALDADNVLIFDPWYTWAVNEGALKIPGNAQIAASGTWEFKDNETKIQLKNGNLMEIIELTETAFQTVVTANGSTNRYTYKHP